MRRRRSNRSGAALQAVNIHVPVAQSRQRGQALIIFALAATALIALAGLAIEGGVAEGNSRALQAVVDGSALAGAQRLSLNATSAQQQAAREAAVLYVLSGLGAGPNPSLPGGCTASANIARHSPGTAGFPCDPDPLDALSITTPYPAAGNTDQILVRIDRTQIGTLSRVIGVSSLSIGNRAVAKVITGRNPFGFALYTVGNLNDQGSQDTKVEGNVYVGGCIIFKNGDNLFVGADPAHQQEGKVEVGYNVQPTPSAAQVWTQGNGTKCEANVATNSVFTGLPLDGTFGAAGNVSQPNSLWSCGPNPVTSPPPPTPNFAQNCPSGEPPVQLVGVPSYPNVQDPNNCTTGAALAWPSGTPAQYVPGCYDSCNATAQPNIPWQNGTYSFVPKTNCATHQIVLQGGTKVSDTFANNPNSPGRSEFGQASDGITFILYNGTSWCVGPCGSSAGKGTITFTAPGSKNPNSANPLNGFVIYSCPNPAGVLTPCNTSGGGIVQVQGSHYDGVLTGLVYAPGSDCEIQANGNFQVTGQAICSTGSFQGGSSSFGTSVQFGGPTLPSPLLQVVLIQ